MEIGEENQFWVESAQIVGAPARRASTALPRGPWSWRGIWRASDDDHHRNALQQLFLVRPTDRQPKEGTIKMGRRQQSDPCILLFLLLGLSATPSLQSSSSQTATAVEEGGGGGGGVGGGRRTESAPRPLNEASESRNAANDDDSIVAAEIGECGIGHTNTGSGRNWGQKEGGGEFDLYICDV